MKKKTTIVSILVLLIMLLMIGCAPNEIVDTGEEDINIVEGIDFIEGDLPLPQVNRDLRERLLAASAIELKDIENRTIGMMQDREDINNFINKLFDYQVEEEYTTEEQLEVIGPINFYFADDDDLFGLINEAYIYIEGKYFLLEGRNKAESIKNTFRSNVVTAPAGE